MIHANIEHRSRFLSPLLALLLSPLSSLLSPSPSPHSHSSSLLLFSPSCSSLPATCSGRYTTGNSYMLCPSKASQWILVSKSPQIQRHSLSNLHEDFTWYKLQLQFPFKSIGQLKIHRFKLCRHIICIKVLYVHLSVYVLQEAVIHVSHGKYMYWKCVYFVLSLRIFILCHNLQVYKLKWF